MFKRNSRYNNQPVIETLHSITFNYEKSAFIIRTNVFDGDPDKGGRLIHRGREHFIDERVVRTAKEDEVRAAVESEYDAETAARELFESKQADREDQKDWRDIRPALKKRYVTEEKNREVSRRVIAEAKSTVSAYFEEQQSAIASAAASILDEQGL